ncbi:hypothetical protein [Bradyrhizobium cytisi]|uniref:Uncharacterized protein n=1 Tax=Bradyrhizobium cytisi TaxID=515489 RepID=A0A5S4W0K5_9BRAD|nr:hypothetical protein [Bradyrhizobium cytisi]TYL74000.1 hypothetical protein FXB38_35835 [Bradyrhizobium cytisi]
MLTITAGILSSVPESHSLLDTLRANIGAETDKAPRGDNSHDQAWQAQHTFRHCSDAPDIRFSRRPSPPGRDRSRCVPQAIAERQQEGPIHPATGFV